MIRDCFSGQVVKHYGLISNVTEPLKVVIVKLFVDSYILFSFLIKDQKETCEYFFYMYIKNKYY
jgi:hypothetical protein